MSKQEYDMIRLGLGEPKAKNTTKSRSVVTAKNEQ